MLRGALVQLGASDDEGTAHPEAIKPAAAMELIQSFLLIHDDIMDRDETRRGRRALYAQYAEAAEKEGIAYPEHYGVSMGICAGDVATFLATELIGETEVSPEALRQMIRLFSREIAHVGLAQMGDLTNGHKSDGVDAAGIEAVYRHKTGRYTFSLPLMLGALVRGADRAQLESLSSFGEYAGIAFQLKDDELGLLADADTLGKPVGSDISENKKTLHRLLLFEAVPAADAERLKAIFGAEQVSEEELTYVRSLLEKYNVRDRVRSSMHGYREEAERLVRDTPGLAEPVRKALMELLAYNEQRER